MQTVVSHEIRIVMIGTALLTLTFGFIFFFIITYNRRHRIYLTERAEMIRKYENEMLKTQIEIQEQTLKSISEEIHDNIGQMLSVVNLELELLPTEDVEALAITQNRLNDVIVDLRNISKSLDPERIKSIGITDAVAHELKKIQRSKKFTAEIIDDTYNFKLEKSKTIILFRMIQEALNNIIKHSKANKISITFTENDTNTFITIADNGLGFDTNMIDYSGLGLKNITNRANLIGGFATINSSVGEGTQIIITLSNKSLLTSISEKKKII